MTEGGMCPQCKWAGWLVPGRIDEHKKELGLRTTEVTARELELRQAIREKALEMIQTALGSDDPNRMAMAMQALGSLEASERPD